MFTTAFPSRASASRAGRSPFHDTARVLASQALRSVLIAAASCLCAAQPAAPAERRSGEDVKDPAVRSRQGLRPGQSLLFNGWGMTPAGEHTPMQDLALRLLPAPDRKVVAAVNCGFNAHGLTLIDPGSRRVTQFHALTQAWAGLAFSADGRRLFVAGGNSGLIHVFRYDAGRVEFDRAVAPAPGASNTVLAGMTVHPATGRLYVCNEGNHEVWALHPDTLAPDAVIPVGPHPHSCAIGGDRLHLYVSNWGGRSVSIVDTALHRKVRDLAVGGHPNDMAVAPDGRLFVACAADNTVHVIRTGAPEQPGEPASPTRRLWEGTREVISTSLHPQSPEGSTPCGVAVAPDGRTLFVANADNNAVMVVDISEPKTSVANGFIPVGWYPSAVAVSPDGETLLVANGKGLASRANYPALAPNPRRLHRPPPYDYIGRTFAGSVSFIARPDAARMAEYTAQVRRNSPYTPATLRHAPLRSDSVIPDRVGDPCPIQHVLYIIKENRTYDQVFGAFKDAKGRPAGNGDPNLVLFGEDVTPNHHQLARDYVLLDNLYCNGEVSVDGHSWCDAAIANDYNQRSWIISYSGHGRLLGNDELERPSAGYLWDLCRRHGVSFKNYGEGAARVPSANRGRWPAGRDMDRVQGWIEDLREAEQTGELPRFMIMSLGENHTSGTTPGAFTPDACVGSNDLGLGRIVEAATRSRFWSRMAIFVIEDDAQNGPDHVDAHRTVGLVISPYAKRRFVDSTLYTTASMVRTIELILGLPPLTQYDAGATPMFRCFQKRARSTPYRHLVPRVDLHAKNTEKSPFALESSRMNFLEYDLAPEDELNRILWFVKKGPDAPYPAPIHGAVFTAPQPFP